MASVVPPSTLEAEVVKISDAVAYINHDIDDAIRAGVIAQDDLPRSALAVLGPRGSIRIQTVVEDMITACRGKNEIRLSDRVLNLGP